MPHLNDKSRYSKKLKIKHTHLPIQNIFNLSHSLLSLKNDKRDDPPGSFSQVDRQGHRLEFYQWPCGREILPRQWIAGHGSGQADQDPVHAIPFWDLEHVSDHREDLRDCERTARVSIHTVHREGADGNETQVYHCVHGYKEIVQSLRSSHDPYGFCVDPVV